MDKSMSRIVLALAATILISAGCAKAPSSVSGGDLQCAGAQDPAGPIFYNLTYGGAPLNQLDVYPACTATAVGTVMFVHGGGYSGGTKASASHPNIQRLRDLGWVIVAIDYRLTPFHMWPSQGSDVQFAIDWWRGGGAADLNAPAFPLVGIGFSAGGHMVEHNNTQDSTVGFDASVSIGGGTYWPDRADSSSGIGLFGLAPAMSTLLDASSTTHLDPADPPLLHIHDDSDFYVPPAQAAILETAIATSGNPAVHSVQWDSDCNHSKACLKPAYIDPFLTALAP